MQEVENVQLEMRGPTINIKFPPAKMFGFLEHPHGQGKGTCKVALQTTPGVSVVCPQCGTRIWILSFAGGSVYTRAISGKIDVQTEFVRAGLEGQEDG